MSGLNLGTRMSPTLNGRAEARVVGISAGFLFLIMLGLLALSGAGDQSVTHTMAWVNDGQQTH